jgi:hypothetical protein
MGLWHNYWSVSVSKGVMSQWLWIAAVVHTFEHRAELALTPKLLLSRVRSDLYCMFLSLDQLYCRLC